MFSLPDLARDDWIELQRTCMLNCCLLVVEEFFDVIKVFKALGGLDGFDLALFYLLQLVNQPPQTLKHLFHIFVLDFHDFCTVTQALLQVWQLSGSHN